ncbi:MAG: tRNA lysidine(34) synthetase TilS [Clostridiales bacterium]|nr:tRNA lysidine(34) synthetase TilS [Clostridiales bacterium]
MLDWNALAGKKICIAVSGGKDSVALLRYLKTRQQDYGYTLSVVHCQHGIRGEESLENAAFVEGLCKEYDLPFYRFDEDCIARAKREKVSLETAARNFRKEAFFEVLKTGKADFLATAHHLNDEAETVLFRLARGTLSGVKAMTAVDGRFIRPFLNWTKEKIEAYVDEHGLEYREDYTNLDKEITRNKLRLEVLPALEEAVPGAAGNLVKFAGLCAEDDELLQRLSGALLVAEADGYTVLFSKEKPLFSRACLKAMKGLGIEKDYTSVHLEDAFLLQEKERGAKLSLPKGVEAEKRNDGVAFYLKKEEKEERGEEKLFNEIGFDGGRYEVIVDTQSIESDFPFRTLYIDKGKLTGEERFRFREEGDMIARFGGGEKTLKKFFNEEKIPVAQRSYLPVVARGKEVLAVCGVEISEKVKTDENTTKVLYLALRKKSK